MSLYPAYSLLYRFSSKKDSRCSRSDSRWGALMVELGLLHVLMSVTLGALRDGMVYSFIICSTSRAMVVTLHVHMTMC